MPDDSLEGWLDAKAEELGVDREELLALLQNGDAPAGVEDGDADDVGPDGEDSDEDSDEETSEDEGPDGEETDGETPEGAESEESEEGEPESEESEVEESEDEASEEGEPEAEESEAVETEGENPARQASEDLRRELDERVETAHEEFEDGLADVREDFAEKIEDVRERVIQVKRETDAKAPADHDHENLRQQTEAVAAHADRLNAELESLSGTVTELQEEVETGFDNFEDVLEYLTDATDDLEAKLSTLAEVTVELRDQTKSLSARHTTRAAADELAHLANRRGVENAKCSHCGEEVHIGLLAEPKCPHCASTFNDVEPKQGFFGSARLLVGDPPALEGERVDWDVESVMDAEPSELGESLDAFFGEDDE